VRTKHLNHEENSEVTVRELMRAPREVEVGEPRDGHLRAC